MTTQLATPYSYVPAPEAHDEVDFMTMFTNQNDDTTSTPHHMSSAQEAQYTQMAVPSLVSSPTAQPPLHAGYESMHPHQQQWPMAHQQQQPQHMIHAHAYPAMDMYNPALGHSFVPAAAAPVAHQYVAPAVALTNSRPASAPAPIATPAFTALAKPEVSTPPASGAAAAAAATHGTPSSVAATNSPASGCTSPVAATGAAATATTADARQVRRKRKLTPEDKRRICEVYRNSQGKIRQEDIAKEYSVDRSTISKILNQEERWLDPEQPNASALLARRPGGRYPAIEEEMHRWLDDAVMTGREVRDAEAREEALKIGLRLGHPHFQASSKWWDGVKRRRIEEGRAMPTTRRPQSIIMPSLVRSYSAMAVEPQAFGAGPSHHHYGIHQYQHHPHMLPAGMAPAPAMLPMSYAVRARSQSSPQVMAGFATQPSSFGPAPRQRHSPERHSPVTPLSRNRSSPGSNGSPRPSPLHRGGSSQGGGRPSPHMRLGASAFGLTPVRATEAAINATVTTPTADPELVLAAHGPPPSLSPLSVSAASDPDVSTATGVCLSPSTPLTPAQATFATVPMPGSGDCMDLGVMQQQQQQYTCDLTQGSMMYMPTAAQPMVYYPDHGQMLYAGGHEYVQPQW